MKTFLVSALFSILFAGANAQQQLSHLKKNDIPPAMKYIGDFTDAVKYTDKDGTHIVITTEKTIATPADDDESVYTAYLYAFSYLQMGGTSTLSWRLNDAAGPCAADVDGKFRPGSLTVTDLDHNGIGEVWLVYRVSCHGYSTPSPMKIIMHEGTKKYAMRGTTRLKLKVTPAKYINDAYTFDEVFNAAPQSFRDYANQLWLKNRDEAALY